MLGRPKSVKSSTAQTVAGQNSVPRRRLIINELSVTVHARRPPSCRPVGTDLASLCGNSRGLGRGCLTLSPHKSASALSASEGTPQRLRLLSPDASAETLVSISWKTGPTTSPQSLPLTVTCVWGWSASVARVTSSGSGRWVESVCARPEIDTCANQPHRERKRYAHQNTLWPSVRFARRVTARLVGGLPFLSSGDAHVILILFTSTNREKTWHIDPVPCLLAKLSLTV